MIYLKGELAIKIMIHKECVVVFPVVGEVLLSVEIVRFSNMNCANQNFSLHSILLICQLQEKKNASNI